MALIQSVELILLMLNFSTTGYDVKQVKRFAFHYKHFKNHMWKSRAMHADPGP